MKRLFGIGLALVFSAGARGQFNDTTVVLDGVVTNIGSFAAPGTNNVLVVTNGAVVGMNGFAAGNLSRTNVGIVTGEGSVVQGSMLAFGGSSNLLAFVDGGTLRNRLEVRGTNNVAVFRNTTSTNDFSVQGRTNRVEVVNSTMSPRSMAFTLGAVNGLIDFAASELNSGNFGAISGSGNRLALREGTKASGGVWTLSGRENWIDLSGEGTEVALTNVVLSGDGSSAPGSRLVVSAGARGEVREDVKVGEPWPNNEVLVTGAGSELAVGRTLRVGGSIGVNLLTVLDGGTLTSSNATLFGYRSNMVTLRGVGTLWTNRAGLELRGNASRIDLSEGARLQTMVFTNIGSNNQVFVGPGSEFVVEGDFFPAEDLEMSGGGEVRAGRIRWATDFYGKTLKMTGGLRVTVANDVALTAETNLVVIADGAMLTTAALTMRDRAAAGQNTTNRVHVTGAGSELTAGLVSMAGRFNQIYVEDGAKFWSGGYTNTGGGATEFNIHGAGSIWEHAGDLILGNRATNEAARVSAGARATNWSASFGTALGVFGSASGNSLTVEGNGTGWTTLSNLAVGINANYNTAMIRDGAIVEAGVLEIGVHKPTGSTQSLGLSGSWNDFAVEGMSTRMNVSDAILFGRGTRGNRFRVANGATVTADEFQANQIIPEQTTQTLTNVVEIDGAGSTLALTNGFYNEGAGVLAITNGGALMAGSKFQTSPRMHVAVAVGAGNDPAISANELSINGGFLRIFVPEGFALGENESVRLMRGNIISGAFANVAWGGRIVAENGRDSFKLEVNGDLVTLTNFRQQVDMGLSAALKNSAIELSFREGEATAVETSTNLVDWVVVEGANFETADGVSRWRNDVQTNEVARFFRLRR